MNTQHQHETELRHVRHVVAAVAHHIDARRWEELRALFADEVRTDYTSLFGGTPQTQSADELIAGWRQVLSPLDATLHLLGPIVVSAAGAAAEAECHVRAWHWRTGAPAGDEWVVSGHYRFELVLPGRVWQIRSMTLDTYHQSGNKGLLQE
jgi:hypothetical protein